MDGKTVDWQDIERLANLMVRAGDDFSEDDKRALELVFEAAGDQLTGRTEAQLLGTRFKKGRNSRRSRAAFKVSRLYSAQDDDGNDGDGRADRSTNEPPRPGPTRK